jgi:hypothetical protein
VIFHRRDRSRWPSDVINDRRGNRYTLEVTYPHAGFSGWHWFVYHNLEP